MHIYLADHVMAIIYCYVMVDVKVILANLSCFGAVWEKAKWTSFGNSLCLYAVLFAFTLKISNLINAHISPALSTGNPECDRTFE